MKNTYKAVEVYEPGKLQVVERQVSEPGAGQVRSLEPIIQLTAWLFAAFEIDFVSTTSDEGRVLFQAI